MYGRVIDPQRKKIALALQKFINARRTIRTYLPDPIPQDVVEAIVESGLWAPTKNNQIKWSMFLISDHSRDGFLKALRKSYSYLSDIKSLYDSGYLDLEQYQAFVKKFMDGLENIPVFAVMIAEKPPADMPPSIWSRELAHTLASCGFAAENMLLTALAWGVGGGLLTLVSDDADAQVLNFLGISPETHTVAMVLTFGYPAEVPTRPPRKVQVKHV